MVRKIIFVYATIFLINSCAPHRITAIPVTRAPVVLTPPKPTLLTSKLTLQSSAMQVEKAQVTDLDALMTYCNQLLKLLDSLN